MSRGDSLTESRVPEPVDLGGLDPGFDASMPKPPPGMRSRRAAIRERRLRWVLTVGALALAAWAVVLWTTHQSVTVGDRSVLAATSATAGTQPPARKPRPIDPNAPGAAWAAPAPQAPAPAPAPAPVAAQDASPLKGPVLSSARGQPRQRLAATPSKHQRRGRR